MYKMGWIKQKPDSRDYHIGHPKVQRLIDLVSMDALPESVDLRDCGHMPPIVDQGDIGACTANAAAAIIDFGEHFANGAFLTPSRLFQYYNTRVEDGSPINEDAGGTIRSAVKAIADDGAIPESWMPYDTTKFTQQPTPDDYDEGKNYLATNYVLIDHPGLSGEDTLTAIKQMIASGYLLEFGTSVFDQIMKVGKDGRIAMPSARDSPVGGHALAIVGYKDKFVNLDGSVGAFIIRNSWGTGWGEAGYGYMPYGYLTGDIPEGGISDVWAVLKESWVNPTPCPTPTPTPAPIPDPKYIVGGVLLALLVLAVIYVLR